MESLKGKIKAVIFDMDGTIIQTESIWSKVTRDYLHENGIRTFSPQDVDFFASLAGTGLYPAALATKIHFGLDATVEEIAQRKVALANARFQYRVDFIHGFEEFHSELRRHGFPTAIATNATPENLTPLRRTMELDKFFGEHIYCIADVGFVPKPDPALFLFTAKKLGAKPEECIVFEDSLVGFRAAKAAGMKCVAIKGAVNSEHLHHALEAIASYDEAINVLKKILLEEK